MTTHTAFVNARSVDIKLPPEALFKTLITLGSNLFGRKKRRELASLKMQLLIDALSHADAIVNIYEESKEAWMGELSMLNAADISTTTSNRLKSMKAYVQEKLAQCDASIVVAQRSKKDAAAAIVDFSRETSPETREQILAAVRDILLSVRVRDNI